MTTSKVGAVPIHGDHGAASVMAAYATVMSADQFTMLSSRMGFDLTPILLDEMRTKHASEGGTWIIDEPAEATRSSVFAWQVARKLSGQKKFNDARTAGHILKDFFGLDPNILVDSQAIGHLVTREFHIHDIECDDEFIIRKQKWIEQVSATLAELHGIGFGQKASNMASFHSNKVQKMTKYSMVKGMLDNIRFAAINVQIDRSNMKKRSDRVDNKRHKGSKCGQMLDLCSRLSSQS